ncbi:BAF_HP2_G0043920.mRNA.1.CDS.1 [Saccharomyces cerevisiae]|nr:BAF_HP2_G0043920.mRNA.1.CDS.1 [Saccharomyces cerevisiae]CAI6664835.1 BAF_HP2_G0043920.mRNA.1.CDS.1 [Saccharomyces cerevisiae]CAI6670756.1 BAF_HP1_G0040980.mRNA.1.CDS.1 [Saccharomyces cerevisiae]
MSEAIFQPTDIVLAKVKGFSAWPAMIIPNELIPDNILKTKPVSVHKGKSGSDKKANEDIDADTESEARDREQSEEEEDIEDFGESEDNPEKFIIYTPVLKFRKNDTLKSTYCVKFFCDDSYIWVKPTDMKILTSEDCRKWLSGKQRKNKKLIPAYEMAMRGKNGIDIWEFVEYGSYGKPDEEEYVEEEEEENEPEKKAIRPTRSSSRQRQKRASETEKSEGGNSNKRKRVTRSTRQQAIDASEEEEEEEEEKVQETVRKRPQRTKTKKVVVSKTKPNPKTKAKKEKPKPPKPTKYHFEDDEDWSIVGLGPQDLSIEKTMDPIAKKLSQKKNLEKHVEIKLDLEDKLAGINKLLCDVLCSAINQAVSIKDDFEIILDELQIALDTRGSRNEFITIFQSNNSLLLNFRILFNLRKRELNKWDLWDRFQDIFKHIYSYQFIPDTEDWQLEQNMEIEEMDREKPSFSEDVKEEESKVGA